jgi:hypothetical protein
VVGACRSGERKQPTVVDKKAGIASTGREFLKRSISGALEEGMDIIKKQKSNPSKQGQLRDTKITSLGFATPPPAYRDNLEDDDGASLYGDSELTPKIATHDEEGKHIDDRHLQESARSYDAAAELFDWLYAEVEVSLESFCY